MMEQTLQRLHLRKLRRSIASWQTAAVGLLVLAVLVNMILYGLLVRQEEETAHWQNKYHIAKAIEEDAVRAYGELLAEVDGMLETPAEEMAQPTPEAYQYIGECTITYYCCEPYEHICGTGDGITATGVPVAPGIVAVDPEVIPLGSIAIIDGTSYLAVDTGVSGLHVDIAVPTHAEALELGITTADVWVANEGEENADFKN